MHDWTLKSLRLDWSTGELRLDLSWDGTDRALVALGLRQLNLSRNLPWGPSVSINAVKGPVTLADGSTRFKLEIQSGDTIEIVADTIETPGLKR